MGDDDTDTSFSMKITEETAQWLDEAFPDQLGTQERVRAAITEARRRRREAEIFVEQREPREVLQTSSGDDND